jgi:catechol 2,3-dioxygenase-like lactoylglutathione lyase family enzyme
LQAWNVQVPKFELTDNFETVNEDAAGFQPILSHVDFQVADFAKSAKFYDAILGAIGATRIHEPNEFAIGYGISAPEFWISAQADGDGFRQSHIAFQTDSRDKVRAAHEAAMAQGAESLHPPKEWPEYGPNYYATFFRDPDGNNVEVENSVWE